MFKMYILIFMTLTITLSANSGYFSQRVQNLISHQKNENQEAVEKYFFTKMKADTGNAEAQFRLAIMYARGEGVMKDEKRAFTLFHKAARNNNVYAKYYMGLSFLLGKGVRKSPQLARYWFGLAAKQGHLKAKEYILKHPESMI